jgi:AsnC-like helix-turn-helix protein
MRAFVLIQADPGPEPLATSLRSIPGILEAESVRGAFDAIVLAQAASVRELMQDVVARIVALPGVRRALPAPLIGSSAEATVAIASVVAA